MKEGVKADFVYVIRHGEFQITKMVYKEGQTVNNVTGVKRDFELSLLLAGSGKLIGDFEVINNVPCQMSVRCDSLVGDVWRVKKEEFEKIKTISEDNWNILSNKSF